jgi:hypothetical protein
MLIAVDRSGARSAIGNLARTVTTPLVRRDSVGNPPHGKPGLSSGRRTLVNSKIEFRETQECCSQRQGCYNRADKI